MQPHALVLVFDKVVHRLLRTDTYGYSNRDANAIMQECMHGLATCWPMGSAQQSAGLARLSGHTCDTSVLCAVCMNDYRRLGAWGV